MSNFILGSGLIGVLARKILGPSWKFIPFKQSRYFSFEIPLCDDFIVFNDSVELFFKKCCPNYNILIHKRPFSFSGKLIYEPDLCLDSYLSKVYGDFIPLSARMQFKNTFATFSHSCLSLHSSFQREFRQEIMTGVGYGPLDFIDCNERTLRFANGTKLDFQNLISTIPLDALLKLCNVDMKLSSKTVYLYRVHKKLDLEGADSVLVSDHEISFFKVFKLSDDEHVFCTFEPFESPYGYLGGFIGYDLDLKESFLIHNYLPIGDPPSLSSLEKSNIFCVGSNAQWDDFMDVSSSIKRLLRFSQTLGSIL